MWVRALELEDLEWVENVFQRRRERLRPHGRVYWAPAADAKRLHLSYLAAFLESADAVGFTDGSSVILAERRPDGWLVDDAEVAEGAWGPAGAALWAAMVDGHAGERVRFVVPVYEEPRREFARSRGLKVAETWWLRELRGNGGESGIEVDLRGTAGVTVPAPPIYEPGGPVLFVDRAAGDDVARTAVERATELGCSGVVLSQRSGEPADPAWIAGGLRPHCEFYEGVFAPADDLR